MLVSTDGAGFDGGYFCELEFVDELLDWFGALGDHWSFWEAALSKLHMSKVHC